MAVLFSIMVLIIFDLASFQLIEVDSRLFDLLL